MEKSTLCIENQVMVVSSVWHGVHPGYYLGLGSVSKFVCFSKFYLQAVENAEITPGIPASDYVLYWR